MRFANKGEDFTRTVEGVALLISLGAVFLQIWVLISSLEAYFQCKFAHLFPSVVLSGLALTACGFSIYLTKIGFLKGTNEGRSQTYEKNDI